MKSQGDCDKIIVVLEHPFGTVEIPLETWIEKGPGPRHFVRPYAVKHSDGRQLPLSVIPIRYRNNSLSRRLIKLGLLSDPWKSKEQGGKE